MKSALAISPESAGIPEYAQCPTYSSAQKAAKMPALSHAKQPWLILQHTYQIQVFTGLTEKEAFHPVLFRLVYDVMQRGIPTPAKQKSGQSSLCSFPPADGCQNRSILLI